MKKHLSSIIILLFTGILGAQPPEPPEGKRWVLIPEMSDEFNDSILDKDKWHDHYPGWVGRAPAIFLPSQLSVHDGMLEIRNKKLEEDTIVTLWNGSKVTYSIGGGAIRSKQTAKFGFFECSMKASQIRMSSTFWLSNGSWPGPDPCSEDRYSLEIDIQEAVGGATESNSLSFRNNMHANTHYRYTTCQGEDVWYSEGGQIKLPSGQEVSDTFYVYGAHWKDENGLDIFLDGKKGRSISFRTDASDKPFDQALHLNAVTETYDWVTPPSDEDLADSSRNATYYDWIRSYSLVGIDEVPGQAELISNPGFETGDMSGWSSWGNLVEVVTDQVHSGNYAVHVVGAGAPEQEISLKANTSYELSCYGKIAPGSGSIYFGIKDEQENYLGSVDITENSFTLSSFEFTTATATALKLYFYAADETSEGWADDFRLVEKGGGEDEEEMPPIFREDIYFVDQQSVRLPTVIYPFTLAYLGNRDLEIHLRLLNEEGNLVGEATHPSLAGYGMKSCSLVTDSALSTGNYTVLAQLRPPETSAEENIAVDTFLLQLVDPLQVDLLVVDRRDNSPLSGAQVSLGDSVKTSDSQGMASYYQVDPGATFTTSAEGFEEHSLTLADQERDTSMTILMTPLKYELQIRVRDASTEEAITSARVKLGTSMRLSNQEGTATFRNYEGEYPLSITKEGYVALDSLIQLEGDTQVDIALHQGLGIGDWSSGKIRVFPNPFRDEIRVEGIDRARPYRIMTAGGSRIKEGTLFPEQPLALPGLKEGVYFLHLVDSGTYRIIK